MWEAKFIINYRVTDHARDEMVRRQIAEEDVAKVLGIEEKQMSNNRIFKGWINPLQFLEIDEPWASAINTPPTLEAVFKFLCAPGVSANLSGLTITTLYLAMLSPFIQLRYP